MTAVKIPARLPGGWETWKRTADEKVCIAGNKWVGACPICQANGEDSKGVHLVLYPGSKAFDCVAWPREVGDEHRQQIFRVLGPTGKMQKADPMTLLKIRKEKEAQIRHAREVAERGKKLLSQVISQFPKPDIGPSDPLPETPEDQFSLFASEFDGGRWWAGERYDEEFYRHCINPAKEGEIEHLFKLANAERESVTRTCSWKETAHGRELENREVEVWCVVEHDKIGKREQVAIHAWAISQGADLEMVIDSGGKSLHGLYRPSPEFERIRPALLAIGIDPQALLTGATRTPGIMRRDTGKLQRIVWIKEGLRKSPPALIRRQEENL